MDLSQFAGDKVELKWNAKDLTSLQQVVPLVTQRRVAVQAGGCLGVFPKYLAGQFATVYTFEPSASNFVFMTVNAPEANIIRFQAALGCKRGMVDPVLARRGEDGKSILHCGMTALQQGGNVPTIVLDDLALPFCDLLYLDVEGWELFALQGAEATIRRHKPVIACEINRGIEYVGLTGDQLRAFIFGLGYKFQFKARSDEVFVPC